MLYLSLALLVTIENLKKVDFSLQLFSIHKKQTSLNRFNRGLGVYSVGVF
jgi:hypothetical protein